jgi:hypothetical protein
MLGIAERPVSGGEVHLVAPSRVQCLPGLRGNFGVDIDGGDVPAATGEVGQERGILAGAGADFRDALSGVDIELVEHHGDDNGLGGTAQHSPVRAAFGDHRLVIERLLDGGVGDEQVARDGSHRLGHPIGVSPAGGDDAVNHLRPQPLR